MCGDFSTQWIGSVGSEGSGWGVTFQHTPVGQSDVATARSRSPRSFSNSTPFERDVEANLLCEILDVVRSEEKEDSPLETEEGEDFDGLLAADEEAADLKASRGALLSNGFYTIGRDLRTRCDPPAPPHT